VSPVTFRHPVNLAKVATTVDEMSGGRIEVGVGAGWNELEHRQLGLRFPPIKERADLLAANARIREGNTAEARKLLDGVEERRPAFKCKVNGEGFSDFRDYNDLTMCVFEVIFKDNYLWLPFEQIQKIELFRPKTLRDLYWIQAKIELINGTNGEMFLPALYEGTWKNDNDLIRLGRMTDWRSVGDDIFIGEGTKLYWMDGRDKSILDIESIEFEHAVEPA
jgi:type VI secretion system protein ImpE